MATMKRRIPAFKKEDEEREFRATHDTTDDVDWSKAEVWRFPKLKPSRRIAGAQGQAPISEDT